MGVGLRALMDQNPVILPQLVVRAISSGKQKWLPLAACHSETSRLRPGDLFSIDRPTDKNESGASAGESSLRYLRVTVKRHFVSPDEMCEAIWNEGSFERLYPTDVYPSSQWDADSSYEMFERYSVSAQTANWSTRGVYLYGVELAGDEGEQLKNRMPSQYSEWNSTQRRQAVRHQSARLEAAEATDSVPLQALGVPPARAAAALPSSAPLRSSRTVVLLSRRGDAVDAPVLCLRDKHSALSLPTMQVRQGPRDLRKAAVCHLAAEMSADPDRGAEGVADAHWTTRQDEQGVIEVAVAQHRCPARRLPRAQWVWVSPDDVPTLPALNASTAATVAVALARTARPKRATHDGLVAAATRPRAPARAEISSLPPAPVMHEYDGPEHGGNHLVECVWRPGVDSVESGAYLDPWRNAADRAAAQLPIILTYGELAGQWRPLTIAFESAHLGNKQYGLYPAVLRQGGDYLGTMLDGRDLGTFAGRTRELREVASQENSDYMYTVRAAKGRVRLLDGASCRDGGPKRANDPRGLTRPANAAFYDNGCLCVRPWSSIPAVAAGVSPERLRQCEILWSYGNDFWKDGTALGASPDATPQTAACKKRRRLARAKLGGAAPEPAPTDVAAAAVTPDEARPASRAPRRSPRLAARLASHVEPAVTAPRRDRNARPPPAVADTEATEDAIVEEFMSAAPTAGDGHVVFKQRLLEQIVTCAKARARERGSTVVKPSDVRGAAAELDGLKEADSPARALPAHWDRLLEQLARIRLSVARLRGEGCSPPRVLVAGESSGVVATMFMKAGADVATCDLKETETPHIPHFKGDVELILDRGWDLVIGHPPCTYLSNAGVCWLYQDPDRRDQLIDNAALYRRMRAAKAPFVAMENSKMNRWARQLIGGSQPTQYVHPWQHGTGHTKPTGLSLSPGLPCLTPTCEVEGREHAMARLPPSEDRASRRSRTYWGIAGAMATQWMPVLLRHMESLDASRPRITAGAMVQAAQALAVAPIELCHVTFARRRGARTELIACASDAGDVSFVQTERQLGESTAAAVRRGLESRVALPKAWRQRVATELSVSPLGHAVRISKANDKIHRVWVINVDTEDGEDAVSNEPGAGDDLLLRWMPLSQTVARWSESASLPDESAALTEAVTQDCVREPPATFQRQQVEVAVAFQGEVAVTVADHRLPPTARPWEHAPPRKDLKPFQVREIRRVHHRWRAWTPAKNSAAHFGWEKLPPDLNEALHQHFARPASSSLPVVAESDQATELAVAGWTD